MIRLPEAPTQKIDRGQSLSFTWQGKPYTGLAGDSVASALFANGIRIVGRSLKYHRPGASTAWTENRPTRWST